MISLTPAQFGALHRKMFEDVVSRVATETGTKKVDDDLVLAVNAKGRDDKDAKLAYPFLSAISSEQGKKKLPIGAACALDEKHAVEVAMQAAKASMGVLTNESAKFLPDEYRACFERLTGEKPQLGTGIAVKGITVGGSEDAPDFTIDFKKVLAGVTADKAVLAVTKYVQIATHRIERPQDQDLPPYVIVITNPDGNPSRGVLTSSGHSSFESGTLVRAGTSTFTIDEDGKKLATLTFHLDATNEYSHWKLPSKKTEAMRAVWSKTLKGDAFDLDGAIERGDVTAKTRKQVETYVGNKALFKLIRAETASSITKLMKDGDLSFAYHAPTKTCAARLKLEGREVLFLLNTQSHKMAGFFISTPGKSLVWREA